jgi:hypothetical protein
MAKQITKKWQGYTVKDCACRFCLYYGGRHGGEIICKTEECVCKEELKNALHRERSSDGSKNQ